MAAEFEMTLAELVTEIDKQRPREANLSSALRCAIVMDLHARAFPLSAGRAPAGPADRPAAALPPRAPRRATNDRERPL
jgi:predicted DNA-binding ribbon-helix-helix protein